MLPPPPIIPCEIPPATISGSVLAHRGIVRGIPVYTLPTLSLPLFSLQATRNGSGKSRQHSSPDETSRASTSSSSYIPSAYRYTSATKKTGGRKLTTAERKIQQQMRDSKKKLRTTQLAQAQAQVWKIAKDLAANLGESADYWHRTLMQITAKTKASHKRSRWNAFVRLKMAERRNRGPKISHIIF